MASPNLDRLTDISPSLATRLQRPCHQPIALLTPTGFPDR
jgi:hypothetical protein